MAISGMVDGEVAEAVGAGGKAGHAGRTAIRRCAAAF